MTASNSINTVRGPNFLTKAVARVRLSLRSKLLAAFLGVVCLLVGITLFALTTLQQANERTQDLIRDQQRVAYFNDIHGYLAELNSLALAIFVPFDGENAAMDGGFFGGATVTVLSRVNTLQGYIGRGVRRFGQDGMADAKIISDLRAALDDVRTHAGEVARLGRVASKEAAAAYALDNIFSRVRTMQRTTYTVVQEIEAQMAEKARATTTAYDAARQSIYSVALIVVGLALLLGYALSGSILWAIRRIRDALGLVAHGHFDTRVSVPNRDELGTLATDVNSASARLGALYDEVEAQKAQLADWNAALETQVTDQVRQIERTNRLRRFLPGQVADMIVSAEDDANVLATQRAEITVLFADLRGFTAFSSFAAPDDVIGALNAFHAASGPLIDAKGGTLERYLGDGVMVLFGAPLPQADAAQRAVDLACDMQLKVAQAMAPFRKGSDDLGLGIGIGTGAATLGQIGFEGRYDYSAIGPAPNLAARLCDKAGAGEIVVSHATAWQVEADLSPVGPFKLKGVGDEVAAFVVGKRAESL